MIYYKEGDILYSEADLIIHQVNCRGVMGSGIAKQIREKYPVVYERYKELCKERGAESLLGKAQIVETGKTNKSGRPISVCNMFSQLEFGIEKGRVYTSYSAMHKALYKLRYKIECNKDIQTVALPYKIGCGLANGSWDRVHKIISNIFIADKKLVSQSVWGEPYEIKCEVWKKD